VATNTEGPQWKLFPIWWEEEPDTGGWKFFTFYLGTLSVGTGEQPYPSYSDIWQTEISQVSVETDQGFTYPAIPISNTFSNNATKLYSTMVCCAWIANGFAQTAQVGYDGTLTPYVPVKLVFRVPDASKTYTVSIPDGRAFPSDKFQIDAQQPPNPDHPPFPFSEPIPNQRQFDEPFVFDNGNLQLTGLAITPSIHVYNLRSLQIRWAFSNSSGGGDSEGHIDSAFVIDEYGWVYDLIGALEWKAGPAQTVEGTAEFYPPRDYKAKLWLYVYTQPTWAVIPLTTPQIILDMPVPNSWILVDHPLLNGTTGNLRGTGSQEITNDQLRQEGDPVDDWGRIKGYSDSAIDFACGSEYRKLTLISTLFETAEGAQMNLDYMKQKDGGSNIEGLGDSAYLALSDSSTCDSSASDRVAQLKFRRFNGVVVVWLAHKAGEISDSDLTSKALEIAQLIDQGLVANGTR
jgi:hypothetical protein